MKNTIISAWKKLAAEKKITSRNTLTYIILRSENYTEALYYIKKAFSPIKNHTKILLGGRKPYDCVWIGINRDIRLLSFPGYQDMKEEKVRSRFREFGIEPTKEQIQKFINIMQECIMRLK